MDSGFQPWRVVVLAVVVLLPVFGLPVRWALRRAAGRTEALWEVLVFAVFLCLALFLGLVYLGGWAMSPR
ncbi:MAG: hypothetical protein M3154_05015 [Candidatus Eremiobacteraeota bacterium]|nr:hypothetical protein [Candidatus Eremiobacteraeota bacterium]